MATKKIIASPARPRLALGELLFVLDRRFAAIISARTPTRGPAEHDHATQARFAQDGVPVATDSMVGLDVDVARGATRRPPNGGRRASSPSTTAWPP